MNLRPRRGGGAMDIDPAAAPAAAPSETETSSPNWLTRRRTCGVLFAVGLALALLGLAVASRPPGLSRSVAVVTVAARRRVASSGAEYGELKSSFMAGLSIDNRVRYCAVGRRCAVVVGGEQRDIRGRSARWNKISLLREALAAHEYEWLVWMDLDALFTDAANDALRVLDTATADLLVTMDYGAESDGRVNTGFFALRDCDWSRQFLEDVWEDNDGGHGESDQRTINAVLGLMSPEERSERVATLPRVRYNAFPRVTRHYSAAEGYDLPASDGDEARDGSSAVLHFAGQFAGGRSTDGVTPASMMLQFLDLVVQRHDRFLRTLPEGGPPPDRLLPAADVRAKLRAVHDAFVECRALLRRYVPFYDQETFVWTGVPPPDGRACEPDPPLSEIRRLLAGLLPPQRRGGGGGGGGGVRGGGGLASAPWPDKLLCGPPDATAPGAGTVHGTVHDLRGGPTRTGAEVFKTVEAPGQSLIVVAASACAYLHPAVVFDGDVALWPNPAASQPRPAPPKTPPEAQPVETRARAALLPAAATRQVPGEPAARTEWFRTLPLLLLAAKHLPSGTALVLGNGRRPSAAALEAVGLAPHRVLEASAALVYADEAFSFHAADAARGSWSREWETASAADADAVFAAAAADAAWTVRDALVARAPLGDEGAPVLLDCDTAECAKGLDASNGAPLRAGVYAGGFDPADPDKCRAFAQARVVVVAAERCGMLLCCRAGTGVVFYDGPGGEAALALAATLGLDVQAHSDEPIAQRVANAAKAFDGRAEEAEDREGGAAWDEYQ